MLTTSSGQSADAPREEYPLAPHSAGLFLEFWKANSQKLIASGSPLLVILLDDMPERVLDLLLHLDDVTAVNLGDLIDQ